MKPFNLELAKAGDAVATISGDIVHFIGIDMLGYVVVQEIKGVGNKEYINFLAYHLYMAPKKVTLWVNLYLSNSIYGGKSATYFETESEANSASKNAIAAAIPIEYEV